MPNQIDESGSELDLKMGISCSPSVSSVDQQNTTIFGWQEERLPLAPEHRSAAAWPNSQTVITPGLRTYVR